MLTTRRIHRPTIACALACVVLAGAPGIASAEPKGVPPFVDEPPPRQDLRSPDPHDAANRTQSPTSSLAGTTSHDERSPSTRDAALVQEQHYGSYATTPAAPAPARPIDSSTDSARAESTYEPPGGFYTVPGDDERRGTHARYELPRDFRTADVTDAADGRGTFTAPQVTVIKVPEPARPREVGVDWADAGIGAGSATALLAITLAGAITVRRRQIGARARAAVS